MTLIDLPTRDDEGTLRAVVETPRGSTVKIKYEPSLGTFAVSRPLVLGVSYPYDWGFFPSTRAPDGDPLDVMIVHDATTYPGVVIPCRSIGLVKVTQKKKEGGGRERNDRVIAVPRREHRFGSGHKITERVKEELEQFFVSAVLMEDKKIRVEGWEGPHEAEAAIRKAQQAYADL
jgi:inorganic pyrophosphatase